MKTLVKGTAKEAAKVKIHNDLANAAFFYKNIIVEKTKNGGAGITFDCMTCALMLAFTWEAYLNYFGSELLADTWNDMEEIEVKETLVLEKLGITPDWARQPYNSVKTLTKIRNWLAHGKPIHKEITKQVIRGVETVTARKIDLSSNWQQLCKPVLVLRAHDDLDAIFREMLRASGIALIDTLTSGEGCITFTETFVVGKRPAEPAESKGKSRYR